MLRNYRSPYTATVVERLEKAGVIILGKTNMDEFGMGSYSIHSAFGPVRRLWKLEENESAARSAGGSSGGSAAAVAASMCHAAIGTDTGGSVRLPAAYCGVYGLKPSYGMISRWGVVAYSNSLDTVGVLGRNRTVTERVFEIISAHDPNDPTSLSNSTRSRIAESIHKARSSRGGEPLRIGVPLEYNVSELSPSVLSTWKATIKHLSSRGHTVVPVSLPNTKHSLSTYYILAAAEASSNLAKYDGVRYGKREERDWEETEDGDKVMFANTRKVGFGDEVRRRILLGTYSLSASAIDNYFIQAQRVRALIQSDFNSVFSLPHPLYHPPSSSSSSSSFSLSTVDVLIAPCSLSPAPLLSDVLAQKSPLDSYVNDVLTVPSSLAGIPAMSVPVRMVVEEGAGGEGGDEPIGMQLMAQFGDEEALFEVSRALEGM
ncbi:amidase signature domain-containing protein [Kalaharituber pfeilii]|nr:amidase signature domain-containing protein [Kalaharituber pfeilii]